MSEITAAEELQATAVYENPASAPLVRWHPITLVAFRFAFCYFMLYALCCGNATVWEVIPFHVGEWIENTLYWPFLHGAQFLAQHLFHLHGVAATIHGGGSGDRMLNWIELLIFFTIAVVATLIWSLLDRRRTHYRKLFFWFRLTLRLTLGFSMLNYGSAKLFPLQMPPPSLAVLNEPLGNTSPMTLLWTLIGLNPLYEMICGLTEVICGVLIVFRRTALLGALLTAFVVSNVVLYNFFFDVPVKIYATHLLLMALLYIVPDMRALFGFFVLHRPSAPSGGWLKPARRYGTRVETLVTAVVLVLLIVMVSVDMGQAIAQQHASIKNPPPYTGQWHIESATLSGKPHPYLTGDSLPMTDIFLEPSGRTMIRATDGALWRAGTKVDDTKHTLRLSWQGAHGGEFVVFAITPTDPTHMTLTPTGEDTNKESILSLTHIPLPTHYPLQDRGFHLVNEWGLER